jgi:cell pole-organizing protein PopZ
MEDVLASIRRILDEGRAEEEADGRAHGATEEDRNEAGEEVFLLEPEMMIDQADSLPDPPDITVNEPDPLPGPPEPAALIIEEPAPMADMPAEEQPAEPPAPPLLAPEAQTAASSSLGALVRTLTERHTQLYRAGPTLEDIVRDELRPMLKSWLDANLPPVVERLVRDEIERVVKRAME